MDVIKLNGACYMVIDSLIEIVHKLVIRCPAVAQAIPKHHDLYKAIDKFTKDHPTLPVGNSGKIRVFKEG